MVICGGRQIDTSTPTCTETSTPPPPPPPPQRRGFFCWMLGFIAVMLAIVGSIYTIPFVPYDWEYSGYDPMNEGENFVFPINPFWYKNIRVATDAPPGTQGLYYFKKCPKRNVTRITTRESNLGNDRTFHEGFYLNKDSTVILDWQTTLISSFRIYDDYSWCHSAGPEFSVRTDEMTNFVFEVKSSDYYHFYWKGLNGRLNGNADYEFHLSSFDTTVADESCDLGEGESCKLQYKHDSSCVVVDYYNYNQSNSNVTAEDINFLKVKEYGRQGKYVGVVIVPILVGMSLIATIFFVLACRQQKNPDEEKEPSSGGGLTDKAMSLTSDFVSAKDNKMNDT